MDDLIAQRKKAAEDRRQAAKSRRTTASETISAVQRAALRSSGLTIPEHREPKRA